MPRINLATERVRTKDPYCPHCAGFGSSLQEEDEICTECGGSGLSENALCVNCGMVLVREFGEICQAENGPHCEECFNRYCR